MRLVPIIAGTLITIISIIAYYYSPQFLSNSVHSFLGSMSSSTAMSSSSILRQMGYPPLHEVIHVFQYLSIGFAIAGIGTMMFGLMAKKVSKPMAIKLVADESSGEFHIEAQSVGSKATPVSQKNTRNDQVMFEVVNNVLAKLEAELKEIKTGYEDHKQQMEAEKKKLEQKQRERMAKIIATGEVLIKEITPDKFEERVKYYVELKNAETGQPVDLLLLAEKFDKMKKTLGSEDRSDITPSEFENMKRFLD